VTIKRGVSLYSYQDEYFLRTLSIEDCIRESAAFGARGIEIIPEQSIPGFPRVSDEFVRWEMGERAQPALETDEPLASGEHDVAVSVRLRISYMPVPGGGRDRKRLTLAA
jgi:hypothetical protein